MGGCCPYRGKYFTYLRQKDALVCANKDCLNNKQKRAKWAKKNWHGAWVCTEGDFENCAVVRRIGKLEVTTSVHIDNATSSSFIPFCSIGGNVSVVGKKDPNFPVHVCSCFQPYMMNDQVSSIPINT